MTSTHGGKREGAGRKPSGTKYFAIRLTPEQHKIFQSLGGSTWIQTKLEKIMIKAKDIIADCFEELASDSDTAEELIQRTRDALEDGEYLAQIGADEDTVNAAYEMLDALEEQAKEKNLSVKEVVASVNA